MMLRWAGTAVLFAALGVGAWLARAPGPRPAATPDAARRFGQVLVHLRDDYVDSLSDAEIYVRAARGLVARLHDPYAALLIGPDYDQLRERTTGDYAGVGIQVEARGGGLVVVTAMPDSPAERAGIRTGDVIDSVDGRSALGWTVLQSRAALRGAPGTAVTIVIRRGGAVVPYRLVRSRVHQSAVRARVLFPDGVGYIRLSTISEHSAAELQQEVASLAARGMRTLLLDLRSNPGGLRDEAVHAAEMFLDPGQAVLETRGRAPGDTRTFTDAAPQLWPRLPIVILVNEGTASAAEILAGALQDHDRALVVGTPTYGKGLVQTVFQLGDRVALRITPARWYTPSGRSIQRAVRDTLGPAGRVDTTEHYRTDAGRVLDGHGGVPPDVTIHPDTLTDGEQRLGKLIAARLDDFRDALAGYAADLKGTPAIASEEFLVTPAMRSAVLDRLRRHGVAVPDSVYAAGARLVDRELGYEIARTAFGRQAEARRRAEDDAQITAARALIDAGGVPERLARPAPPPPKMPSAGR
jgi:carboxyl-terminal processing protease